MYILTCFQRHCRQAAFHEQTTEHKDVAERLKYVDPQLYREVKSVLEVNKAQRHIRGGLATRKKYLERR